MSIILALLVLLFGQPTYNHWSTGFWAGRILDAGPAQGDARYCGVGLWSDHGSLTIDLSCGPDN